MIWLLYCGLAWGAGELKAEEKTDEPAGWDVNAPPGEGLSVSIDTTTGTWMSVDVSPDGQQLAFDLLGDIYLLPIAGGDAVPITSGMAWDMQPKFSPDGASIAFTSDRAGGDNLWIMEVSGENPRQITKESFRLLNAPEWSPDGRYLIGRKHFTSTRSLGSGEIWMYDITGGAGLQLTKKTTDQKDLGEPVFSPDGRHVYYSKDTTPGKTFEYNKDPNAGIYSIERLDTQTGDIERITGGPGGAVRPTPSPDGAHLAFVRRVRDRSVLMLRDLQSGAEQAIWDGLDRDMQETWAIHGVYPHFAWMPDGQSIVIWAGGQLVSVQVPSGDTKVIPFRVRDTREVRPAHRRTIEVSPDMVSARMIRGARVSPDGKSVVYQALGKLWLKSLPHGTPQRLTRQKEHFEMDPTWSRDGRKIAYVTWDDESLGAIRVVGSRGGQGRIVTVDHGHYREPEFSPDGGSLVYRKTTGGWLRTPLWSSEPGLYRLDLKSKASERLLKSGTQPHFGANVDTLFFLQGGETLQLKALELSSRRTHTIAESKMGANFRVSPDGEWLAMIEEHNVHLRRFPRTGRLVQTGPKGKDIPQVRVSKNAGIGIHFANGSAHWTLGPDLFSVSQARAFEAGDSGFQREEVSPVSLLVEQPKDKPDGYMAIVGARIVTMNGQEVIENGTVLWKGDRILAVGDSKAIEVGHGVATMDGTGLTVLPGLVDVHYHGSQGTDGIIPEVNWGSLSALSFGVTTMHDPSNNTEMIFSAAELQRTGEIVSPRIFSTGKILYGAKSRAYTAEVEDYDQALTHLERMKAVGAISVKSYNQPRRDQRQQLLEAGRETDVMVVPEGGSTLAHNLTQIIDGHTGVEHSLPVAPLYEDILQLWSQTKVGYTPTLGVAYGGLGGEQYWYGNTDVWADERLLSFVPQRVVDSKARRAKKVPESEYHHITIAKSVNELHRRGVNVQIGAHGQREGLAAHWEVWMMEQGGMTPHEALHVGTIEGAKYLGLDKDIGSLEPGKLADMMVVEGDILKDLRSSTSVRFTVLGGRIYAADRMNEVWPNPSDPPRIYFHHAGHGEPTLTETHTCGCGSP